MVTSEYCVNNNRETILGYEVGHSRMKKETCLVVLGICTQETHGTVITCTCSIQIIVIHGYMNVDLCLGGGYRGRDHTILVNYQEIGDLSIKLYRY